MMIPTQRALILQDRLLTYDDCGWSCASMIKYTSDGGGSYLRTEWQDAVDNIYRCQKSGLLTVDNTGFFDKYGSLVEGLRRVSPFQSSDEQILWMATFLSGTDKLHQLVEQHDAVVSFQRDVLNTAFIEDLERIFAESDVPWSSTALVPVIVADR
jgi:hypothetical protein